MFLIMIVLMVNGNMRYEFVKYEDACKRQEDIRAKGASAHLFELWGVQQGRSSNDADYLFISGAIPKDQKEKKCTWIKKSQSVKINPAHWEIK